MIVLHFKSKNNSEYRKKYLAYINIQFCNKFNCSVNIYHPIRIVHYN